MAGRECRVRGGGAVAVPAAPGAALAALLDPATLRRAVPAAEAVEHLGAGRYRAAISLGVGPLRVRQVVELTLVPGRDPGSLDLAGTSSGRLAHGHGAGHAVLEGAADGGTRITWRFEGTVGGIAALAGEAALSAVAHAFAARFFAGLRRAPGIAGGRQTMSGAR